MSNTAAPGALPPFKHTSLNLGKAQIRLLRISSKSVLAGESATVKCTIRVFDHRRSSLPQYRALSYVWGSNRVLHNILLNGRLFAVRENLWHFLNDYDTELWSDTTTYWWIDQLCIDQDSKSERNHQVKLMSSIYRDAEQVVSWLGRSKFDSPFSQAQDWRQVVANPYWTRLWVVQEIMLAKRWTILYGPTTFDGDSLFPALDSERLRDGKYEEERDLLPVLWVRQKASLDFPPQLVTCLINFAYLRSAEPHDKIYALLGLTAGKEKLPVDYNLAPIDVFWAAMDSLDGNLVIDPSGIVRLAYDMDVIDESRIVTDVRDRSFSYMSIDEIRLALKGNLPIHCTSNVLEPIEAQRLILGQEAEAPSPSQRPIFDAVQYKSDHGTHTVSHPNNTTRKLPSKLTTTFQALMT